MKYTFFFTSLILSGLSFSQVDVTSSGGDYTSSEGSVSVSIGQVVYSSLEGNGYINQGVQQPYEFFFLDLSEQMENFGMHIFPNPTSGLVNIEIANSLQSNVKLIDVAGKEILQESSFIQSKLIDLSNLSQGTYFLTITNSNHSETVKIIKN